MIFSVFEYRIMTLVNLFVGAPQSKYAALAIFTAIAVVSLSMLFGKEPIPLSQKFAFVLLVFLISLPGLLLSLFQLTCIVTGAGASNQRWWCSAYAWIISIITIMYCVFLVVVSVLTLTNGQKALLDIAKADAENFESNMASANDLAAKLVSGKEEKDQFKVQGDASEPAPVEPVAPILPTVPTTVAPPSAVTAVKPVEGDVPQPFVGGFEGGFMSGFGAPF